MPRRKSQIRMVDLAELGAGHLAEKGAGFTADGWVYATTGRLIGAGGMGRAYLGRRRPADGEPGQGHEDVVLKVLSPDLLWRIGNEPVFSAAWRHNLEVGKRIARIDHPHVLPQHLALPLTDNFLVARPLADCCLSSLVQDAEVRPRDRLALFAQALEGLAELHRAGVVHGDFTPRNILVFLGHVERSARAAVFDFDLSACPELLAPEARSYGAYFQGHIVGNPEYSMLPEVVDEALGAAPISSRGDVYAAGASLYFVLTGRSVYGPVEHMSSLLSRIADGIVRGDRSEIRFPRGFPRKLRPVVETCLQRDPAQRFADARDLLEAVRGAARTPAEAHTPRARAVLRPPPGGQRLRVLFRTRPDKSLTERQLERAHEAARRLGYRLVRCLHRVRGHGVFIVEPDPALLAQDQFLDRNAFRKVLTAVDLTHMDDPEAYAAAYLGRIRPVLERVRQAYLTSLYRAVHDESVDLLLLFTEYVAKPRFGGELVGRELPPAVALALGLLLAQPLVALHAEGVAHNNVGIGSVMLQPDEVLGTARPLLAGLVEPSLEPHDIDGDARGYAELLASVLETAAGAGGDADQKEALARVAALAAEAARAEGSAVPVAALAEAIAEALGAFDRNFPPLRAAGGDVTAYARLLVEAPLYHRLFRT